MGGGEEVENEKGARSGLDAGGLVIKSHRLLYHSTLGLRVIKKKKMDWAGELIRSVFPSPHINVQRFRGGLVFKAYRLL